MSLGTPLSVVIPTYERFDLVETAVESLLAQSVGAPEIVVVDNASPSNITDRLHRRFGNRVRCLRLARNLFFCGAVNAGLQATERPYFAVLNDDARVSCDWAGHALETLREDSEVGSVASLVTRSQDSALIDSTGDHLDVTGRATNLNWSRPASSVRLKPARVFSASGSCAVFRRKAVDEAGRFDESFVAYLDDIDLGFRLQLLGYSCAFNPDCTASHLGGGTSKRRLTAALLAERNMVWNLWKNMPDELLVRYRGPILAAQSRPAPMVGGSSIRAWAVGKAAAFAETRSVLAKRRRIQASRRVSISYVEQLLLSRRVDLCHL